MKGYPVILFLSLFSAIFAQGVSDSGQNLAEVGGSGYLSGTTESPEDSSISNPPALLLESDIMTLDDGTIWNNTSQLNPGKISGVLGGVALIDVLGATYKSETWYNNPHSAFHTLNWSKDMPRWQQMDKMGHMLHAHFASSTLSSAYRWAGVSGPTSIWLGSVSGWLWMLQIEIADGFFEKWGFSWADLLANTAGSGLSALQQYYPESFGGIQFKVSYHVSDALKNNDYGNPTNNNFLDDYDGMTFWVAVNIFHYLPEKWKRDYPEWLRPLGIALGHSAKGLARSYGHRELLIGLDIDLRKIPIAENNGLVKFLKKSFNYIRLPLPAVKIRPEGVWYGLYF